MRLRIRQFAEEINQRTVELHQKIIDLNNHKNKCVCDEPVMFNFSNVICYSLHSTFCLNCGGKING